MCQTTLRLCCFLDSQTLHLEMRESGLLFHMPLLSHLKFGGVDILAQSGIQDVVYDFRTQLERTGSQSDSVVDKMEKMISNRARSLLHNFEID